MHVLNYMSNFMFSLQILIEIVYDCFSNTSMQQIKTAIMTREMVD